MKLVEISKIINVSPATISRVINGTGYVSDETRQKVMDAIEKYGQKSLKKKQAAAGALSKQVALLVSSLSCKSSYPDIAESMCEAFDDNGYETLVYNTRDNAGKESTLLHLLFKQNIEGICICSSHNSEVVSQECAARNMPVVFLDTYPVNVSEKNYVTPDFVKIGYIPTTHLIQHGHKQIGLITDSQLKGQEVYWGYQRAMNEAGIEANPKLVAGQDYSFKSGYQGMNDLLDRNPDMTAVFIPGRRLTYGAIKALSERKISYPEDIALIGYDIEESDIPMPLGITSMTPNNSHIGKVCAEMLVNIMKNKKLRNTGINRNVLIEPNLIIRSSCGCTP